MRVTFRWICVCLAAIGGCILHCGAAQAQLFTAPAPAVLVQPRVLCDVSSIAPGQTIAVAVEFHIAPGWHIYWQNPGQAGSATQMDIRLPGGFVADAVQYSIPETIGQAGDITMFGYTDAALLTQRITAPATLSGNSLDLPIDLHWLVCNPQTCIPGKAALHLSLPIVAGQPIAAGGHDASSTTAPTGSAPAGSAPTGSGPAGSGPAGSGRGGSAAAATEPVDPSDFAFAPPKKKIPLADWQQRWEDRMPIPLADAGKRVVAWGCTVADGAGKLHVQLADVTDLAWYPMLSDSYLVTHVTIAWNAEDHTADVQFAISPTTIQTPPPGLLVYRDSTGQHGILVPPAPAATQP